MKIPMDFGSVNVGDIRMVSDFENNDVNSAYRLVKNHL